MYVVLVLVCMWHILYIYVATYMYVCEASCIRTRVYMYHVCHACVPVVRVHVWYNSIYSTFTDYSTRVQVHVPEGTSKTYLLYSNRGPT